MIDNNSIVHWAFEMKSSTRLKANSQTAGFTLLELLVIVVMVGILAAIAAPSWINFLNRQRVTAVRSDLVQTVKLAQQDAIRRRQTVTLEFFNNATGYPVIDRGFEQVLGSGSSIQPNTVAVQSYYIGNAGAQRLDEDIAFDYQGKPINEKEVLAGVVTSATTQSEGLPFVVSVFDENLSSVQCVIVSNLIGSIKIAEGSDCALPDVDIDPTSP